MDSGCVEEFCFGRARTGRCDRDASIPTLGPQRFAEVQDGIFRPDKPDMRFGMEVLAGTDDFAQVVLSPYGNS